MAVPRAVRAATISPAARSRPYRKTEATRRAVAWVRMPSVIVPVTTVPTGKAKPRQVSAHGSRCRAARRVIAAGSVSRGLWI